VADVHDTPSKKVSPAVGGFGVAWTDQRVPFQLSATVPVLSPPTAVHAAGEVQDTPYRMLYAEPGGSGACWSDQLFPFHASARFTGICLWPPIAPPTAVHAVAEAHDTPSSRFSTRSRPGVC